MEGLPGRRLCRPFDQTRYVLRLGNVHRVAGRNLDRFAAGPLGHVALEIRIDVVVASRDQHPALLLMPGGSRYRRAASGLGQHRLRMGHEVRLGGREVGGKIRGEGGRVKVQEIVLGGAHVVVGGGGLREQANCTLALVGDEGGDETELVLTHERLPTPVIIEGHTKGWGNILDHLADAVFKDF